jgi:hypothetical protein
MARPSEIFSRGSGSPWSGQTDRGGMAMLTPICRPPPWGLPRGRQVPLPSSGTPPIVSTGAVPRYSKPGTTGCHARQAGTLGLDAADAATGWWSAANAARTGMASRRFMARRSDG